MIDVRELERRWLRYQIKKYFPHALFLLSTVVIVIILSLGFFPTKEELSTQTLPNAKQKGPVEVTLHTQTRETPKIKPQDRTLHASIATPSKQPVPKKPPLAHKEVQSSPSIQERALQSTTQILKPSMDFLRKMKDNSILPENEPPLSLQPQHEDDVATHSSSLQRRAAKDLSDISAPNASSEARPSKHKLNIKIKKTSKKDLKDIIRRFKKSNNPVLGVFIAKKYYEMGDYHKAYNYALITNQIDSDLEDSWIIFAKSLVKLGHKNRAIKTLKAYIQTSQSSKAQILLNNIKTGKFQ